MLLVLQDPVSVLSMGRSRHSRSLPGALCRIFHAAVVPCSEIMLFNFSYLGQNVVVLARSVPQESRSSPRLQIRRFTFPG